VHGFTITVADLPNSPGFGTQGLIFAERRATGSVDTRDYLGPDWHSGLRWGGLYQVRTYRNISKVAGPAPACPVLLAHPWVKVVRADMCLLLYLVTDAKEERTRPAHGGGQREEAKVAGRCRCSDRGWHGRAAL
jgi:hypothetical protein